MSSACYNVSNDFWCFINKEYWKMKIIKISNCDFYANFQSRKTLIYDDTVVKYISIDRF